MRAKNAKAIRRAFKTERGLDVLGPADRRVSSSVDKTVYVTNSQGETELKTVKRLTMVNVTKTAYRQVKKKLVAGKKPKK